MKTGHRRWLLAVETKIGRFIVHVRNQGIAKPGRLALR